MVHKRNENFKGGGNPCQGNQHTLSSLRQNPLYNSCLPGGVPCSWALGYHNDSGILASPSVWVVLNFDCILMSSRKVLKWLMPGPLGRTIKLEPMMMKSGHQNFFLNFPNILLKSQIEEPTRQFLSPNHGPIPWFLCGSHYFLVITDVPFPPPHFLLLPPQTHSYRYLPPAFPGTDLLAKRKRYQHHRDSQTCRHHNPSSKGITQKKQKSEQGEQVFCVSCFVFVSEPTKGCYQSQKIGASGGEE